MKKLNDLKNIADATLGSLDISQQSKLKLKNDVKNLGKINIRKLGFIGIPAVAALLAFIMFFTGIFSNNPENVYASDLMDGITPQKIETPTLSEDFLNSTADFSIELFKKSYTKGENSLISPTSVYLALGMTANGADGNTLKEFESLLGKYNLNMAELNSYYSTLSKELMKISTGKVNIANSIWFSQDKVLNVKKDFLQTNADYYRASAYKADFNSKQTTDDINNWVKNNTNNLIDKIVDVFDANTIMYLINTVYFEDQWEKQYSENDVRSAPFTLLDGTEKTVDFMHSEEAYYIKDSNAQGFIKPYKNGKYSFVALLPNEEMSIDSYIKSLSGENFIGLIKNKSKEKVSANLPEFKSGYELNLVDSLKQMGLKDCFNSKANFTKMAKSSQGDIRISKILHKTFVTVDTHGTKAGAATRVEMKECEVEEQFVNLNRPFVYAIIDNETNLPLFMGTMINPEYK